MQHWTQGVHHDGSDLYVSNPLPAADERVQIRLRTPLNAPISAVYLRSRPEGELHMEQMHPVAEDAVSRWWEAALTASMPRNPYRFKLMTPEGAWHYNGFGISRADSPDYFDFRLVADYRAPVWVREAVFYQIFPDRFHNGDPTNDVQDGEWVRSGMPTHQRDWGELPTPWNESKNVDFFGGDLQGITQKLDYLQGLGVTALYLNPIFSAESNHHYDISDFNAIDPHFGGDEALAELRAALDERGMKLVLDITPNHIGSAHAWFQAVQTDPAANDYFFYVPEGDYYETWLGVPSLIKLNYRSQRLRHAMYRDPDSAMRRWLRPPYRIDGWRLDVANMMGIRGMDDLTADIGREMHQAMKADDPDFYLMGEHFYDGTPHLQGDELDASMNYHGFNFPVRRWLAGDDVGVFKGAGYGDTHPMATADAAEQMRRFMAALPYAVALQQFNQLSSHDIQRFKHIIDGDPALHRLATTLLMAFPGTPCLYYGDEIGLTGGNDPDNRRCMPWNEAEWDQDLQQFHQRVIRIRRSSEALQHGGMEWLWADGEVMAFQRQSKAERVLFIGCRGGVDDLTLPVTHGGLADGEALTDLLSGRRFVVADGALALVQMARGEVMLLRVG